MITIEQIEAGLIPIDLGHLEYYFGNIEESHPLIADDGNNKHEHEFLNFAFDAFRHGDPVTTSVVSDVLEVWLLRQHLAMQYSPGDAKVLSGAAKAYDYVSRGHEFVETMEEFKTEFAHASPAVKREFLQVFVDRLVEMLAEASGVAA